MGEQIPTRYVENRVCGKFNGKKSIEDKKEIHCRDL